jgi:peptide/nickel transport system permease protein
MHRYVARRLLMLIPMFIGVSLVVFIIMRLIPGDIASIILMGPTGESGADPKALAELRHKLGLDQPLPLQYLTWVAGLARLDAGNSLWSDRPVFAEILERLPLTVELSLMAIAASLMVALPTGILSAVRQDSWVDYLFRVVSIAGLSIPNFWLGTLIILVLSLVFFWTPPLGYVDLLEDPWTNLQQTLWPALALGYNLSAVTSRMTRSAMLEVLRQDYIKTAWAKGLAGRAVVLRHALKNALLPVITLSSIQLGALLGGTVIMETIFTLPGVGRYLVDAIFHRDYPVTQTIVTMMGIIFVCLNLVVDLLYAWIDPRIRYD